MDYDYLFKVILVGDSAVGKTSLVRRFTKGFSPTAQIPTIGVDVEIKTVDINGQKVKFKIWDSAGHERFKSVTTSYYRTADAAIIVYAIDHAESFANLSNWLADVENYSREDIIKIVVGNKKDLEKNRMISQQGAVDFALMMNADAAMECSAKEADNVDYLFFCLAKKLVNKVLMEETRGFSTSTIIKYPNRCPSIEQLDKPFGNETSDFSFTKKSSVKRQFLKSICKLA